MIDESIRSHANMCTKSRRSLTMRVAFHSASSFACTFFLLVARSFLKVVGGYKASRGPWALITGSPALLCAQNICVILKRVLTYSPAKRRVIWTLLNITLLNLMCAPTSTTQLVPSARTYTCICKCILITIISRDYVGSGNFLAIFNVTLLFTFYTIKNKLWNIVQGFPITQAEMNNRTNVDPTLDTNFRLSADSRNDNDVLRWYNTSFQRCINTGNQHIFNAGCQHF